MVSLVSFVRSAPRAALREYFEQQGIALPETVVWSAAGAKFTQPLVDAIDELEPEARALVKNAAERVGHLADEAGQVALYSVLQDSTPLDAQQNGIARALYVLSHDPAAFRQAEEARYSDAHRRGRMWSGYVAKPKLTVARVGEPMEKFKSEIRNKLQTENVYVDIFDRTRSGSEGEIYELIQATIYRDGRVDDVLEFVEGQLSRRPMRQVIEASLTYEPSTGVIEVVASKQEVREGLVELFGRTLLGCRSSSKRLKLKQYDLASLARPHDFPTDPEDNIERVSVSLLRLMPFASPGARLTLECDREGPNSVWQMAADQFRLFDPLRGGWIITKAKLLVRFRPAEDARKGKVLPLTITMPHGCDLKERTTAERIIGDKYLKRWGVLKDV
jgi:hypothetical protein